MNTLNVKVILHLTQMSKKTLSIDRQKTQTLNKKQFLHRLYCNLCMYLHTCSSILNEFYKGHFCQEKTNSIFFFLTTVHC